MAHSLAAAPRTVVFLTEVSDPSIPDETTRPACLLPMGWASVAERVMISCAEAGLRELDLVASDSPERLRAVLGDGGRWGLRLRWHLARDGRRPYGVLHDLLRDGGDQVLIGHAHRWIAVEPLRRLLQANAMAQVVPDANTPGEGDGETAWAGWASLPARSLQDLSPEADAGELARHLCGPAALTVLPVAPHDSADPGSAGELLALQGRELHEARLKAAPATWIRMPWGLLSPDAHVHPKARLVGPVVVGPGCVVTQGAELGPQVVLSHNVMVADGASLREALVLDNTYVSGEVHLAAAVAGGASVYHDSWGVKNHLPLRDSLLLPLDGSAWRRWRPSTLARAVAWLVLGLSAPLVWPALVWRRRQAPAWQTVSVVQGVGRRDGALRLGPVRLPTLGPGAGLARWGAVLDVAQGRRAWFGARPRTPEAWARLRPDWQTLLADIPVGVFHSPAWQDDEADDPADLLAVADAYFAVSRGWRERLRILGAVWRGSGT